MPAAQKRQAYFCHGRDSGENSKIARRLFTTQAGRNFKNIVAYLLINIHIHIRILWYNETIKIYTRR